LQALLQLPQPDEGAVTAGVLHPFMLKGSLVIDHEPEPLLLCARILHRSLSPFTRLNGVSAKKLLGTSIQSFGPVTEGVTGQKAPFESAH
jgi:hypothetical protein